MLRARLGFRELVGALGDRALERVARSLQRLARLVFGSDVVVDPDRALVRAFGIDRLADELAPEAPAVLAPLLALGGYRAPVAHFLVPGAILLMLLARVIDRLGAAPEELAALVAEHLLQAGVAALVRAVAQERDADSGVAEDQLLLGKGALHAMVGLALGGDVLKAPDPLLDVVADVDAPATVAAAEQRPVAPLEDPLGVVRGARRGGQVGERAGFLPVVLIGEQHRRALADDLARPGAHHLLEKAVAALDDAVAHERDAHHGVVEDQLLLGKRALDALFGEARGLVGLLCLA